MEPPYPYGGFTCEGERRKRTKSRALYILKYLWLYTDDEPPASISDLTAIEDEPVEQRKAVLELFKKKRAGEISPTEYDRNFAKPDDWRRKGLEIIRQL